MTTRRRESWFLILHIALIQFILLIFIYKKIVILMIKKLHFGYLKLFQIKLHIFKSNHIVCHFNKYRVIPYSFIFIPTLVWFFVFVLEFCMFAVGSSSSSSMREKRGSKPASPSTSPCALLRDAYHNCFHR